MLVQYQDAVLCRGDNAIDSATCKLRSQLHGQAQQFGDQMGRNSATGERGLKDWAKFRSKTALKHGRDKFTQSTPSRASESLLVSRALDQASRAQNQSSISTTLLASPPTRRKISHFRFERKSRPASDTRALSMGRHGKATAPNGKTGYIQPRILQAIDDVERHQGNEQEFFEIWCEARLSSGEFVRCWPQRRGAEGSRHDWIMASFGTNNGPSIEYPAKLIALYEDATDGTFKALIHSVEWKLNASQEGPCGDSRLVTRYRLQLDNQGNLTLCRSHLESLSPSCCPLGARKLWKLVSALPKTKQQVPAPRLPRELDSNASLFGAAPTWLLPDSSSPAAEPLSQKELSQPRSPSLLSHPALPTQLPSQLAPFVLQHRTARTRR